MKRPLFQVSVNRKIIIACDDIDVNDL
jgi:hypothetical protein